MKNMSAYKFLVFCIKKITIKRIKSKNIYIFWKQYDKFHSIFFDMAMADWIHFFLYQLVQSPSSNFCFE